VKNGHTASLCSVAAYGLFLSEWKQNLGYWESFAELFDFDILFGALKNLKVDHGLENGSISVLVNNRFVIIQEVELLGLSSNGIEGIVGQGSKNLHVVRPIAAIATKDSLGNRYGSLESRKGIESNVYGTSSCSSPIYLTRGRNTSVFPVR
jgi:hypothetical protein